MRFSLGLLFGVFLASFAGAGPYSDLDKRIKTADPKSVIAEVRESGLDEDDANLTDLLDAKNKTDVQRATSLRAYIGMHSLFEAKQSRTTTTPIADIKKSGLYRAAADDSGENWLARAIERIRFKVPSPNIRPRIRAPGLGNLAFLTYIVWGILALLVGLFLFFAIRYFRWQTLRRRRLKTTAMLEDDEPERSLDEWLQLAAQLEAEGRYREAVRCLYVACLLRFDEHRVARFDRTQTNWEHYRRIQASPANPSNFDFRGPTQDFDQVWYGFRPIGSAEVQQIRATYQELTTLLSSRMAATR